MKTFTARELDLIGKLREKPAQTTLQIREACPLHSVCTPLPLFRVYKMDDATFEAQWNEHHHSGTKQVFSFSESSQEPV
jgi:hypothetical protein